MWLSLVVDRAKSTVFWTFLAMFKLFFQLFETLLWNFTRFKKFGLQIGKKDDVLRNEIYLHVSRMYVVKIFTLINSTRKNGKKPFNSLRRNQEKKICHHFFLGWVFSKFLSIFSYLLVNDFGWFSCTIRLSTMSTFVRILVFPRFFPMNAARALPFSFWDFLVRVSYPFFRCSLFKPRTLMWTCDEFNSDLKCPWVKRPFLSIFIIFEKIFFWFYFPSIFFSSSFSFLSFPFLSFSLRFIGALFSFT